MKKEKRDDFVSINSSDFPALINAFGRGESSSDSAHSGEELTEPAADDGKEGSNPSSSEAEQEAKQNEWTVLPEGGSADEDAPINEADTLDISGDGEDDEVVPALFGSACLDKYKPKAPEPVFPDLSEQPHEPTEQPMPVPTLFSGIGKLYYPSDDILRLAAEYDAEEEAMIADGQPDTADDASGNDEAAQPDTTEVEPDEPAPAVSDLMSLIDSFESEDRERENTGKRRSSERERVIPLDPYNTAFNDRGSEIDYDSIPDIPLDNPYKLDDE